MAADPVHEMLAVSFETAYKKTRTRNPLTNNARLLVLLISTSTQHSKEEH
jgi:hypothetical protein